MCLAEKALAFVDAKGTHDRGRAGAVRAGPIEGIVASQEPHRSTAEATVPCAYDLAYQRRGTPEVVLVGEFRALAGKRRANLGAHGEFGRTNPKGAHVAAALEPCPTEQSIELFHRSVRAGFKVEPVTGSAIRIDAQLQDRLSGA
jgi:hypothetical protein